MNRKINISFMTEEALETLKANADIASDYIRENKLDSSWIAQLYTGEIFEARKEMIPDFTLKVSLDNNYRDVEFQNAVTLYEALKDLPRRIITDERFWAWINLGKCYPATTQAMPIRSATTFKNMWLFGQDHRRSIFFGANSRLFFWTELTVEESLDDPYLYTKFVIEKHDRIRHLTWRANSNNKHIVLSVVKAEKKLRDRYAFDPLYKETFRKCEAGIHSYNIYTAICKYLSLYGSVRVLDAIPTEELQSVIYQKLESILMTVHSGNLEVLY